MRLKVATKEKATRELLNFIREIPGIRTSALMGTPLFHGHKTLRPAQIIRLLRKAGLTPTREGVGARTYYTWRLNEIRRALAK